MLIKIIRNNQNTSIEQYNNISNLFTNIICFFYYYVISIYNNLYIFIIVYYILGIGWYSCLLL